MGNGKWGWRKDFERKEGRVDGLEIAWLCLVVLAFFDGGFLDFWISGVVVGGL